MKPTVCVVCLALTLLPSYGQPQQANAANLLAGRILAGLARVRWNTAYQKDHEGGGAPCQPIWVHPDLRGGLYDYARHCSAAASGVVVESFYYPTGNEAPAILLRRADFRVSDTDPALNASVEQLLKDGLTHRYGAATVPDHVFEIGAYKPHPGLSWRAGSVIVFLHHNRTYVEPSGIRQGVQLIAVRREVLENREELNKVTEALGSTTALSRRVVVTDLKNALGNLYLEPRAELPRSEAERSLAESQTRAVLFRLLARTGGGDRNHRAAILVAADDLTVRLGSLLISRSIQNGSEILNEVPNVASVRRQLSRYGIVYTGPGHYSGDLEYDRHLLARAWKEFPDTGWGQRAFLMMQRLSCTSAIGFSCHGPNCFREVIRQGEAFLRQYPQTEFRKEQVFQLALAYETWWSLSKAKPDDPTAEGANVNESGADVNMTSAENARQQALSLYEELARMDPESPEARAGRLRMPRLKLGLSTGERSFFCFSC